LAIVGGGLAGTCCAITAARAGLKVVLIQDRPVLGGNASSEVRLWILGATSHLGNNNRWAREGGVADEILVENTFRNPEGNPYLLDALLLEKVVAEPHITLLLNTAVYEASKDEPDAIRSVRAFCSQNSTAYEVTAPLFCDASGDGILGFLAGAAFRMGAEASSEFGEKFAPATASRDLLGHSLYFYSRDTGRPVRFVPPSFALKDITRIPRWRDFNTRDAGCRLWWIEWGGRLDTVHDTETVKWELWKVVYGVWNHIKNSGQFPEAENLTLEWVGSIPGKRESRRFEGDYLLTQNDIVEQREHPDAVSYGGWAIDLHPVDGVFSKQPGCSQWHAKGVYQIPYRCLYSRNIRNLFLAGRLVSASHIAFGSTRVMATCAHSAQAVGWAAAVCRRHGLMPREAGVQPHLNELQQRLLHSGQFIPRLKLQDPEDLVPQAEITASSSLRLHRLEPNGERRTLRDSWAMLLPVVPGPAPAMRLTVDVEEPTTLKASLRVSVHPENHTPETVLGELEVTLPAGKGQSVRLAFDAHIDQPRYAFYCLEANDKIAVWLSDQRLTGVLSLTNQAHRAVAESSRQTPPPDSGLPEFEFWIPQRRPAGKNFALELDPPPAVFGPVNVRNGVDRPTHQPNAWVAGFDDARPTLTLTWAEPQTLGRLELVFDTDYDHPMESVLLGHPEQVMPFCVPEIAVRDGGAGEGALPEGFAGAGAIGEVREEPNPANGVGLPATRHAVGTALADPSVALAEARPETAPLLAVIEENHESRRIIRFDSPVITRRLILSLARPSALVPAALLAVRAYAP